MTIEIVGGILSEAPAGDTPQDRRAAHFLPDPRTRNVDPAYIRWQARQDELDGFDRSLIHIYSAWADPWLIAAHAGTSTTTTALTVAHRPGVTAPTVAARSFATLDKLTAGRAATHIVVGSSDADVRRDGDFLDKHSRYQRAHEYLELFTRALTADEPFDYQGRFYHVEDAWTGFTPVQQPHPPISIGGSSTEAQELAAKFAYAYAGSFPTLDAARTVTADLTALAGTHQRTLRFWKQFFVIIGDTETAARDTATELRRRGHEILATRSDESLQSAAQIARSAERELRGITDIRRAAQQHLDDTFDTLVIGSIEQVAEHITAYHRAGIDIAQVVALTETDEDRKLRARLVAELRR
ncbi:LLM class flavin-dependent oxidoreductase [Rhodococcus rhodochrous]|uniref:LLM class flavin-dependent oxidoreductase n=1 Tax=Rhodococcus rhodochrous TaxID=1829 RepID=UPI001E47FF84|nr:LLM class flavin-dependent oxidoreductase [Rhodococcus rhodochrous]MCB8913389.1 LLM class flavin-dependent oxidoreductase [Rhodococcus rhodochrous]